MIALLSVLPPLSPRAIQARNAFSRRSRRAENCRNGSTLERDSVMTCLPGHAALGGGGARGGAHEIGQAGEIGLAVEHQRVGLLVGQHVLAERGAERRQPLGDLGQPLLARRHRARRPRAEHRCDSAPARAPARR